MFKFKCLLKELIGLECAGCGGTRMILSLLQLDFYQAFRYNPGIFILLIIGALYIIYNVFYYIKNKKIVIPKIKWFILIFILLIVYMLFRNIPGFEFLLPTEV